MTQFKLKVAHKDGFYRDLSVVPDVPDDVEAVLISYVLLIMFTTGFQGSIPIEVQLLWSVLNHILQDKMKSRS